MFCSRGWSLAARTTLGSDGIVMCQKALVEKATSLEVLQHLNSELFEPRREPTVNISQAILCTFFPPPPAPHLSPPLPPCYSATVLPIPVVETDRSSPPPSQSLFSLSSVKASLGFTTSNSAPISSSPLVPTVTVIPPALPLPPSSQLYIPNSREPCTLVQSPCSHAPPLPSWAQTVLDAGVGALGGTCKVAKVGYALVFTSDGSKHAVAAEAAAVACGISQGADSSLRM
jgi:hypothetical protein